MTLLSSRLKYHITSTRERKKVMREEEERERKGKEKYKNVREKKTDRERKISERIFYLRSLICI